MIKLIAFDLDGVLVDSKNVHYYSLNQALKELDEKYVISYEEHLAKFDGRSTTTKLNMLHELRGLSKQYFNQIWQRKQFFTKKYIDNEVNQNDRLIRIFSELKKLDYKIAVVSNAIFDTVQGFVKNLGIFDFVDKTYCNTDVPKTKPSSLIYLKCMLDFGVQPTETLILQDSHIGRKSALSSGGHLMQIERLQDVTLQNVLHNVGLYSEHQNNLPVKWHSKRTNVVIPMAGRGSRFQKTGYTFPKPLIQVHGKPMIQVVIENLNIQANFIYIVQKQHYERYNLYYLLNLLTPNCTIIQTQGVTEGAACTSLLAKQHINNNDHLVIANSDQYIEWQSNEFFYSMLSPGIDGGILTFQSTHPKWSFVKLDEAGYVSEVAEKKPISNIATVGVYYWNKGSEYVKYAEQMIEKNIRVNNQFYVCPVYNQAIIDNKKFKTFNIKEMWGLGTPEDLKYYQENHNG